MNPAEFQSDSTVKALQAMGGAVSDANRLKALRLLSSGEQCVCTITENLGLATSTVSKHMQILRDAGLVTSRRSGKWIYYSLATEKSDPLCTLFLTLLKLLPAVEAECKNDCEQNSNKESK